jgi:hypothetical protein
MDVKPGDLWQVGDEVYLAQTGPSGILLRHVILPEQLEIAGAVLVFRQGEE